FPGTAMTYGQGSVPVPYSSITEDGSGILQSVRTALEAHPSPTAETLAESTKRLRRYIRRTAPALKALALALPGNDSRRTPAQGAADEAFYRALRQGPGDGLISARDYCTCLLRAAQNVRDHYEKLRFALEAEEHGGLVVTDAGDTVRHRTGGDGFAGSRPPTV
ncbi:DUF6415 family natural product biosynthesis protein, partial [Streptomyces gamaensis]